MPIARPSNAFEQWQLQHCSPTERRSITGMIQDLNSYGLARKDPDLKKLKQDHPLSGPHGVRINVFVMQQRISASLGRAPPMWFGVVEVAAGPASLVGRLLVLKGWKSDPGIVLVAVEMELIALAQRELP